MYSLDAVRLHLVSPWGISIWLRLSSTPVISLCSLDSVIGARNGCRSVILGCTGCLIHLVTYLVFSRYLSVTLGLTVLYLDLACHSFASVISSCFPIWTLANELLPRFTRSGLTTLVYVRRRRICWTAGLHVMVDLSTLMLGV